MAQAETGAVLASGRAARGRAVADVLRPVVGFGAPMIAALVAILVIHPYYGIVDDGPALGLVRSVGRQGFFHAYGTTVWDDARIGGQVRPFYWVLEYVEYRAGLHNPTVLYVLNWLYTGLCLAVAGLGLAAAFRVPTSRRSLFLGTYGAAVFVFPWTLDMFAFPSPQERSVALAAGLGLLWFARPRERMKPAAWYTVSALVVVLGSLTKATFLINVPVFLLLLLDWRRRGVIPWSRVAWVAGVGAATAIALRIVGIHGGYTDQFRLGNIPSQLHSHYLWLLSALAVAWAVYAIVRYRRGTDTLLLDVIPVVAFAGFVAVYLQWQGWVFYVISFVVAGAFALLVARLPDARVATAVLVAAIVWAVAWTVVRTGELYGSLASIGQFARSPAALSLARAQTPVYISCQEGSQTIAHYVLLEQGTPLTVQPGAGVPWQQAKGAPPPAAFTYALADRHLCPAKIDGSQWSVAWRPSRSSGFTLYRRTGS